MLTFETTHKPENYVKIVERIQRDILKSVIEKGLKETNDGVLREIIYLFKHTDKEDSVNSIFNIVKRVNDDMYKSLNQIILEVIFRQDSILKQTQYAQINRKIDELLKSENPKIQVRGRELSKYAY